MAKTAEKTAIAAIAAHHGRAVKRTGDGSIVEFRSVVDAVRCAIEVQNGLEASALNRFGPSVLADLQRIDVHRFGDVLELRGAQIADLEIEPRLDLTISVLGKADRARLGDAFQPRRDVHPVAHEVAVALLDNVIHRISD